MASIVENIVQDDYLKWKQGDSIIINTYTGSGKTHFVFNKLLRLAVEKGKKIICFCNRRTIKNQLLSPYKEKLVRLHKWSVCEIRLIKISVIYLFIW